MDTQWGSDDVSVLQDRVNSFFINTTTFSMKCTMQFWALYDNVADYVYGEKLDFTQATFGTNDTTGRTIIQLPMYLAFKSSTTSTTWDPDFSMLFNDNSSPPGDTNVVTDSTGDAIVNPPPPGPNVGAIIGGSIAGGVFLIAIIVAAVIYWRTKRTHKEGRRKMHDKLSVAN